LTATTQTSSLPLPATFTIEIWSDAIVFNGTRLSIDGAPQGYVASGNGWRLNLNPVTATTWEWSFSGASGNAIGSAVTR
jgi:hypothetical protein